jgi:hypothetical protein
VIRIGHLLYLDVPKVGSTFVRSALQRFARPGVEVAVGRKHRPPTGTNLRGIADIAVTVGRPENYFLSLFRAGLEGRGGMRCLVEAHDGSDLYHPDKQAFHRWCERLFSPDVQRALRASLGLRDLRQPLRPLSLQVIALVFATWPGLVPRRRVASMSSPRRRGDRFHVLRTEHLESDLAALMSAHPDLLLQSSDDVTLTGIRRNMTDSTRFSPSNAAFGSMAALIAADRPAVELWDGHDVER